MDDRHQLWSPDVRANPHPFYAQVRQTEPVYRGVGPISGNTFWFFTRHEDVTALLKDARFSRDWRKVMPEDERTAYEASPLFVVQHSMLTSDPPEHTRLRRLVHKAFTPPMIAELEGRIEAIAHNLIDDMEGTVDLIEAYAFPLPITVIAEMLGIPTEERETFRRWTKALLYEMN